MLLLVCLVCVSLSSSVSFRRFTIIIPFVFVFGSVAAARVVGHGQGNTVRGEALGQCMRVGLVAAGSADGRWGRHGQR